MPFKSRSALEAPAQPRTQVTLLLAAALFGMQRHCTGRQLIVRAAVTAQAMPQEAREARAAAVATLALEAPQQRIAAEAFMQEATAQRREGAPGVVQAQSARLAPRAKAALVAPVRHRCSTV
jgi:hypothetical protein